MAGEKQRGRADDPRSRNAAVIEFAGGTDEAGVSGMRLRAWRSPRAPGVYPVAVEIPTGAEPAERLEVAAVTAGWPRLEAPQAP